MDNPLVQPDPGLFIWTIATFLLLAGLLAKFAWRPLLQALEARQETIRKSLEEAQQARQELERINQESARILSEARVEAGSIVARSRSDADRLRTELREQARTEAATIVRNAERQIALETERARQQIRREAAELSVMIAEKLIRRNINREDNERLIAEALAQIRQ